jgi:hypothetical protein
MIPIAIPGCATMGSALGSLGAPPKPWTLRDVRGLSATQITTASRRHASETLVATDQIARQIQQLLKISAKVSSVLLGASA